MTQHLPTWAQAARGLAIALSATALLFATIMLARADGDARSMLAAMRDSIASQANTSAA